MLVYDNTKMGFSADVLNGVIEDKICNAIFEKMGRNTPKNEIRSWVNSLEFMNGILVDHDIPDDAGVAIEYNIPYTSKRVDVILSGFDAKGDNVAVVIELKQWERADKVENEDGIVRTVIGGNFVNTAHPSYQAWSYVCVIKDFNQTVQDRPINMHPCAFLHNYKASDKEPLTDDHYIEYTREAPVFLREDRIKLRDFIKKYIKHGDNKETLYLIDKGKLRPSKSLQDVLSKMLNGNEQFVMLDKQKVIFEKIMRISKEAKNDGKKHVLMVEGGPGTGKSVLAVNLLVRLTSKNMVAQYVTKNQAPRQVYGAKLKGSMKNASVNNLFRSSGTFYDSKSNTFDVLLVDEAHRLNEKSGLYQNLGENQIKEIINASKLSVFFIDESQRVTVNDIGTKDNIVHFAKEHGALIHETEELDSQFRCNGSDGYMAWVDDVLRIEETANFDTVDDISFDIRIFKDPNEMRRAIEEKNSFNNRSRMVAGYCWNWITEGKNRSDIYDISIPEFNFNISWNLGSTGTWAIDANSIKEAGCIHTCQGLEFEYVGIIIGNDLRYENGEIITDRTKRAKTDQSLRGLTNKYKDPKEAEAVADEIIKNTYRTLMTRGMSGCYIYCVDKGLEAYLEKRIDKFRKGAR